MGRLEIKREVEAEWRILALGVILRLVDLARYENINIYIYICIQYICV